MINLWNYNTSEPILIYIQDEDISYNKTKSNMILYGSEFVISNMNQIPINVGIGFFFGTKNPVVKNGKTGSILDHTDLKLYLLEILSEYNRNIFNWLSGSIGVNLNIPYTEYNNDIYKNFSLGINSKFNLIATHWLSFNIGLDYIFKIPEYKKTCAAVDACDDQEAQILYSRVNFDKISYQFGLSFSF